LGDDGIRALSTRARLSRALEIVCLKVSPSRSVWLRGGLARLSACGRLGLRRATLYHCAVKDDLPAPAAIAAWHDPEFDIGLRHG
jgi:hypothetical protein